MWWLIQYGGRRFAIGFEGHGQLVDFSKKYGPCTRLESFDTREQALCYLEMAREGSYA